MDQNSGQVLKDSQLQLLSTQMTTLNLCLLWHVLTYSLSTWEFHKFKTKMLLDLLQPVSKVKSLCLQLSKNQVMVKKKPFQIYSNKKKLQSLKRWRI